MKIGILTQPMAANYGCNLQAYALQTTLERMGHSVEILDRWGTNPELDKTKIIKTFTSFAKDCIKFCIRRPIYHSIKVKDRAYFWQNIISFQKNYLHISPQHYSYSQLKNYVESVGFDGYVVGSDQVWRPSYNKNGMLENMFLDFTLDMKVKKISYAASFGVDEWEYTDQQTLKCSILAKQFDGISVREDSAIMLCKKYLGVNAKHVLDPTMLLNKEDYNTLIDIDKRTNKKSEGNLFCYILDSSDSVLVVIDYVETKTGLKRHIFLPNIPENGYDIFHKENSVLPSPEEWLKSFRDAKLILVDSFHGAVFSIIYNKPFWVIANRKRGMARFYSLLKMFKLEERLVNIEQIKTINLEKEINWDLVNSIKNEKQIESLDFLERFLK